MSLCHFHRGGGQDVDRNGDLRSHREASSARVGEGCEGKIQMLHRLGRVGGLPERALIISCTLIGPSKESGLGFHDNRQAASQGNS